MNIRKKRAKIIYAQILVLQQIINMNTNIYVNQNVYQVLIITVSIVKNIIQIVSSVPMEMIH